MLSLPPMTRRFTIFLLLLALASLTTAAPACANAVPHPAAEPAANGAVCQLRNATVDPSAAAASTPLRERIVAVPVGLVDSVVPEAAATFGPAAWTQQVLARPPLRTILRI